ncbi:hypothetical protein Glove_40g97 [Diversispora epigaea]|uniref:Galactose oxidase n=1 Tax=Diversispora epigaea TaxID=1348612 RepID=A0A397JPG2_9GLOM|nr:hypothetical protein Glove_40g97 [Diversispora epigaea]
MTWKTLSITNNLPSLSSKYSAGIFPNGIIVYFGGQDGKDLDVTGDGIDSRSNFTSVLTPDRYIIIFGGRSINSTSVSPNLAILDTNKSPYEWSIPSSSKDNSPPSIYGHTANLYYNYMIITFGYDIDNQTYSSKVYLYDITNNTWVTRFEPSPFHYFYSKVFKAFTDWAWNRNRINNNKF